MSERDRPPRLRVGSPGPGPGAGADRDPERAAIVLARIALVATVVVGQLWALTVALNAYFEERMATVWWLFAFQCVSFLLALAVWLIVPDDR
jgi:cytochrome bd-type quinol oxidase subunit 2